MLSCKILVAVRVPAVMIYFMPFFLQAALPPWVTDANGVFFCICRHLKILRSICYGDPPFPFLNAHAHTHTYTAGILRATVPPPLPLTLCRRHVSVRFDAFSGGRLEGDGAGLPGRRVLCGDRVQSVGPAQGQAEGPPGMYNHKSNSTLLCRRVALWYKVNDGGGPFMKIRSSGTLIPRHRGMMAITAVHRLK